MLFLRSQIVVDRWSWADYWWRPKCLELYGYHYSFSFLSFFLIAMAVYTALLQTLFVISNLHSRYSYAMYITIKVNFLIETQYYIYFESEEIASTSSYTIFLAPWLPHFKLYTNSRKTQASGHNPTTSTRFGRSMCSCHATWYVDFAIGCRNDKNLKLPLHYKSIHN